jgi:hypothetical protein|tara:strand:- start:2664 stop:2810 length:147 start_codon:yes stop_codon:yes gene_type:complete
MKDTKSTVFKKTKRMARNAAVSGKPGGKKTSKTKITGTPLSKNYKDNK